MAEPTLTAVFGTNATQTATTITISKTDLAAVGLTASASNTAESLLAAIMLKAKTALTQDSFNTNLDQSITIQPEFDSIITRSDELGAAIGYRQTRLSISLHKLDTASGIDPDDY